MLKSQTTLLIMIFILLGFSSCHKENSRIYINLDEYSEKLTYSQISKKLDYIVLKAGNKCLLSDIEKIFFDKDTLIIQDTRHEGIFVFTTHGDFVKHINYIGQGPEEYRDDNSIAVDTILNQIYIYDMMNFKINKYSYNGAFISSDKMDSFIRDFAITKSRKFLMIQPCINKRYGKNGLWLYHPDKKTIHPLLEDSGEDQEFEFMSTYITQTENSIYYYDRNDDNIYLIENDSLHKLYGINLKQYLPNEVRKKDVLSENDLNQKAMMSDFCISNRYIIINYFIFGKEESPFKWVMIDRENNNVSVFKHFTNDIDDSNSSNNKIFYLNDSTWCRLVDQKENDDNIVLQLIHLK